MPDNRCQMSDARFQTFSTFWQIYILLILLTMAAKTTAQVQVEFNGTADVEFMKGGEDSHYYINGIHKDLKDGSLRPLELNLLSKIHLSPQWTINLRLQMERDEGKEFNQIRLNQANIQWNIKDSPAQLTFGRFVSPFGLFSGNQLSTSRTFVDAPLAYGYFINISEQLGYVTNLGNGTQIPIEGKNEWGLPMIYYNSYATGAKLRWAIKPNKITWDLALTTGAPNTIKNLTFDPLNYGIISRLKLQPTYFWKQGISVSHGSFKRNHPLNKSYDDLPSYRQTLIGADFVLGFGHFEFSGEAMTAFYSVPSYLKTNFWGGTEGIEIFHLQNWGAYLDAKYELPFLVGSYAAYRIEALQFGKVQFGQDSPDPWDDQVVRHTIGLGSKIKDFILLRSSYAFQIIQNQEDKNFNAWRTTLTLYF
jgi:hypothetical protein